MAKSLSEILAQIDIRQLYEELTGESFIRHKGAERAKNVFREDSDPSLTYRPKSGLLYDFAEQKAYSHLEIVKKAKQLSESEAISFLYSFVGEKPPKDIIKEAKEIDKYREFLSTSLKFAQKHESKIRKWAEKNGIPFKKEIFYHFKIGVLPDAETIKKFGFEPFKGFEENALVFPLADRFRRIVGFQIRHMERKDFRMIGSPGLFGMLSLKEEEGMTEVVLVEGEKDLLSFACSFDEPMKVISYGSADAPDKVIQQIPKIGDKFFIIPDNDVPGREIVKKIYRAGAHVMQVVLWGDEYPDKFDISDYLKMSVNRQDAIKNLNFVSFPRFIFAEVEEAYNLEPIEELKLRVAFAQAEKLVGIFQTPIDKEDFKKLCKSLGLDITGYESTILTPVNDIAIKNNQYILVKDDEEKELTNFIIDFKEERELVSNNGKIAKTIRGDVKSPLFPFPCEFTVDVSKTVDPRAFLAELRRQCSSELLLFPPMRDSELYTIAMSFKRIKKTMLYIVPGRPISADYCRRNFGTPYVFLYPGYSAIGPRLVKNSELNIDVQLQLDNKHRIYWEPVDHYEWKDLVEFFVNELMGKMYKNHPAAWIPMGFSLSNLFKPIWETSRDLYGATLIIHGRTGSKKSTLARFAQNFWGQYERDSDLGQFADTKNASKKILAYHGMAQCTYDEFKPGVHSIEDLTETIHSVYSGRDKLRLSRDGQTLKDAEVIMAHFTFNTEQLPTLGESLLARSLTLRMPQAYGTREDFEKVNQWSMHNQFKMTPLLATWMYKDPERIREKFMEFRSSIFSGEFMNMNNADRVALNYTKVAIGVWALFEMAKELGAKVDYSIPQNVLNYINEIKYAQMDLVESHSFANLALTALKSGIMKGSLKTACFHPVSKEWFTLHEGYKNEIDVCAWIDSDGKGIYLAFFKTLVNKMSKDQGLKITQEALKNELKEMGLLQESKVVRYKWYGNKSSQVGRGIIKIKIMPDTEGLEDLYSYLFPQFIGKNKEE